VGRPGLPRQFLAVTSNHEHPHRFKKWGWRLEKEENGGRELATVDRDGGDAPVSSEQK
jgi:hypothetical protein